MNHEPVTRPIKLYACLLTAHTARVVGAALSWLSECCNDIDVSMLTKSTRYRKKHI